MPMIVRGFDCNGCEVVKLTIEGEPAELQDTFFVAYSYPNVVRVLIDIAC